MGVKFQLDKCNKILYHYLDFLATISERVPECGNETILLTHLTLLGQQGDISHCLSFTC